jgi:hypothetical protein
MKSKARYVQVDRGYGCAESWCRAKVIKSCVRKPLFPVPGEADPESLLVELLGGERIWVDFWKEE